VTDGPDRKARDLEVVLEITRRLGAAVELDEILRLIIDRSMDLLDAERASIFLYEQASHELVSRVAAGEEEIRFPADKGVAGATVQDGQTLHVPDAYADERFNPEVDKRTGFRTRNILSVPLRDHEGALVGVLQVLNKRGRGFSEYDIYLAESLAAQAGVSLQRARLIEHFVEKQKLERDLSIAHDIQQGLLPAEAPEIEGYDLAGFNRPADDTGGDTYDFLPLGDGRWLLIVADASGHGIGPALVIAETRAMLRAVALRDADPAALLATVNTLLDSDLDGRFVTCFLGVLDPPGGTLSYASAGHGPLLFYERAADAVHEAPGTGPPLGILGGMEFEGVTHPLSAGDTAVILTDGFFEGEGADREQFGIERVGQIVRDGRDAPAAELVETLRAAVDDFTAGRPQADDLTAIVVRRLTT